MLGSAATKQELVGLMKDLTKSLARLNHFYTFKETEDGKSLKNGDIKAALLSGSSIAVSLKKVLDQSKSMRSKK